MNCALDNTVLPVSVLNILILTNIMYLLKRKPLLLEGGREVDASKTKVVMEKEHLYL